MFIISNILTQRGIYHKGIISFFWAVFNFIPTELTISEHVKTSIFNAQMNN